MLDWFLFQCMEEPSSTRRSTSSFAIAERLGSRANALVSLLKETRSIAIVCHTNPDTDCVASAVALMQVAREVGVRDADIFYDGEMSQRGTTILLNSLNVETTLLDSGTDLGEYERVAFVDHSLLGMSDRALLNVQIDIVIGRHSSNQPSQNAEFADVRQEAGTTTTIMLDYLRALDADIDAELATGLFFAIQTETLDFQRRMTPSEYEAVVYLHPRIDTTLLARLNDPPLSPAALTTVGEAILARKTRSSYLFSFVGPIEDREALTHATEYLLKLEGTGTAVVAGIEKDTIRISARSTDRRVRLERMLREAFGDQGEIGGHDGTATAKVPLGLASDAIDREGVITMIADAVERRFFDAVTLDGNEAYNRSAPID